MRRVGILPTLVTMANGYCGLLSIYKTHDGHYGTAALLIMVAMIFDVLDGMVARKAGITSRFGAYLDSLSDAISFGVAPAFLVKAVVEASGSNIYGPKLLTVLTALFALCAMLRLARYNVEHTQGEGSDSEGKAVELFAGMPTPGAAGVPAALVFLQEDGNRFLDYGFVYALLPVLCAVLGYLMVSRVPYIHFGARFLKVRRDFLYLFRVVVVVIVVFRFPHEGAALGFILYGFSGPVRLVLRRRRGPPDAEPPDHEPYAEISGDGS
ncbi:MAG: CDP-diacylglycerol--serine O-phosphatidyltransferase [Planctomycetota bacterium]|jgi:CDP-diacylglycerol--serine O-phosphatidyltransferase